jgi:hypothetical protein
VVQPDDTLWAIAARTSPGRSPHAVVAEIRRLNGLGATTSPSTPVTLSSSPADVDPLR